MRRGRPVAVVTGASRGIGRAIAEELTNTHVVIGTSVRHGAGAERGGSGASPGSSDVTATDRGVLMIRSDISSAADRAALVERVREQFGHVDLLVNNAGIAPRERRDLLEASEESYDEVLSTNLKGPYFLTQRFAKMMLEQESSGGSRGRIVFVTSISAYTASVNRGDYCVSKAGLSMSATLYASRLAGEAIQVFEIRPGIIQTDMTAPVAASYEERAAQGLLPQRRIGQPVEVARVVRAIADGLLDYSTGQVIDVDGGFHLRTL